MTVRIIVRTVLETELSTLDFDPGWKAPVWVLDETGSPSRCLFLKFKKVHVPQFETVGSSPELLQHRFLLRIMSLASASSLYGLAIVMIRHYLVLGLPDGGHLYTVTAGVAYINGPPDMESPIVDDGTENTWIPRRVEHALMFKRELEGLIDVAEVMET